MSIRKHIIDTLERARLPDKCEHPEAPQNCEGEIVRSHVIQRANVLESVADDGHVMTFRVSIHDIIRTGPGVPQRIGLKKASTFGGFCRRHDREAFADVECTPLVPTRRQAFLLCYRSLVSEMRSKHEQAALDRAVASGDSGVARHSDDTAFRQSLRRSAHLAQVALRDIGPLRVASDKALSANDPVGFSFLAVRLAGPPLVVASQILSPEFVFSPRRYQDWANLSRRLEVASFCIVPQSQNTLVLFGWHTENRRIGEAISSSLQTLPKTGVSDAIYRFAFCNAEFVYFKPSWWQGLDAVTRAMVCDLVSASVGRPARPDDHLPNSRRLSRAEVIEIEEF